MYSMDLQRIVRGCIDDATKDAHTNEMVEEMFDL
jgi:hypothetical protein